MSGKISEIIANNTKQTTIKITKEMHQKLKMLAYAKDLKIYELMFKALDVYIKENEKILKTFLSGENEECE